MLKLAPVLALILVLSLAPTVSAQSTPTLDQGIVMFTGSSADPQGLFTFAGPQFLMLTGGLRDGNFQATCIPCYGGQEIHIGSVFSGSLSIRPGNLTTGLESRFVYYQGYLTFDSSLVTLPIHYGRLPFEVVVPITLQGNLEVHATDPFANPNLLFQTPVSLQGSATLQLKTVSIDWMGRPVYQFLGLTYDFHPANEAAQENELAPSKVR